MFKKTADLAEVGSPYLGLTCDYMSIKYCMLGFVFILTKLIGRTSDQKLVDWTKHFKSIVVVSSKHGQSIQMLAKSSYKVALNPLYSGPSSAQVSFSFKSLNLSGTGERFRPDPIEKLRLLQRF